MLGSDSDDDDGSGSGSAYVFTRSGVNWSQQSKLTASDAAADDRFGNAVSISGNLIAVGAHNDDHSGANSGSAYIFGRTGVSWTEQSKLIGGDTTNDDRFGKSVGIDGDTAVIGAHFDNSPGNDPNVGSAYVFTGPLVPGAPTNVIAVDGNSEASVTWDAPASNGGSAITQYAVTSNPGGFTALATTTATTVVGLTNGTSYTFTVTATNSIGTSTSSVPSNAVTPAGVSITGTILAQGANSTTTFAAIGATVSLTPSGGGASTTVAVAADGSFSLTDVPPGSYTITANGAGFLIAERQNVLVAGSPIVMPLVELRGGDANDDGVVSIRDISIIAASFGATPVARVDGSGRVVDINGDGAVNIVDISNAASNFGVVEPLGW